MLTFKINCCFLKKSKCMSICLNAYTYTYIYIIINIIIIIIRYDPHNK